MFAGAGQDQKTEAQQKLRDQIFDLVVDPSTTGPSGTNKLRESLSFITDSEYLQRALEVAEAINDSNRIEREKGYEFWKFADELKRRKTIEAAHHNLDLIRSGTNMTNGFSAMLELHEDLTLQSVKNGENPVIIDRLDNHLRASNLLRDTLLKKNGRDFQSYADEYAPLVSRYPDHCEELCAYLLERGGIDGFNEDGFNEYRNTAKPLSEGAL